MEMGFMAKQEQSLINRRVLFMSCCFKHTWLCFLLLGFCSCQEMKSDFIQTVLLNQVKNIFSDTSYDQHLKSQVYRGNNFSEIKGLMHQDKELFTGQLVTLHDDSSAASEHHYHEGLKHGQVVFWHANGQKAMDRLYEKGVKVGMHRAWYPSGQLKFCYPINKIGQYHGEVKEWFESGQLYKSFNFVNGKQYGSQRMWTAAGIIRANYVIKNGDKYGLVGLKRCYKVQDDSTKIVK